MALLTDKATSKKLKNRLDEFTEYSVPLYQIIALAEASSPALDALAEQSYYATLQRVGGNYWTPAESLGKNILEGNVSQQLLDDAVAGIEQPVDAAQ